MGGGLVWRDEGVGCLLTITSCEYVCLGLRPGPIVTVVINTSHSSEVQLSAASLEGGGCMILRCWVEILTFSNKAIWKQQTSERWGLGCLVLVLAS